MLFELVRRAAQRAPERPAVISRKGELAYAECLVRAQRVAAGLVERGVDRFGCFLDDAGDAVVVLVASSAVGREACLYPADPGSGGFHRLATRLGHRFVVSERPTQIDGAVSVRIADLEASEAGLVPRVSRFPVLILTTGTTGAEKGARHDWSRLIKSVHHLDDAQETTWLLAYNLNQFAGVQVLLHALASAATMVEPRSRSPEDVIAALREHRITHASGTPTFWRLLAGRLDYSLAHELSLQQITLGGEATPQSLIQRLRSLFPGARVSHVYAGTEFGSVISVGDGQSGLPISVLDRESNADAQLRIVAGELWIRSRVGMLGYHGHADDSDRWRPTGDLVEVRDGRIHFVGRTSEIINVGGAKVHPLPVEELISSIEGVLLVAVYGRPNAVTGQIVAADVVADPAADLIELERRIRERCRALTPPGRPRRIRFVPRLDVRGSKLMRRDVVVADEVNVTDERTNAREEAQ